MLNTTKDAANLVNLYRALRNDASKAMEDAARLVREYKGNSPDVIATLDANFETAWERFESACDDLREVEHGYRQTFPHPMGRVHPTDAYSRVLSRGGNRR